MHCCESRLRGYLEKRWGQVSTFYNFEFLVRNLKLCGSWPPINAGKRAYMTWSVIVTSLTLGHLLFVQTAFVVADWKVTGEMASAVSLLINNYVHAWKVYVMFRYQKRIQRLLDDAEAKNVALGDLELVKNLQYQMSWTSFTYYGNFQLMGIVACSFWTLSSAVRSLKDETDRVLPLNGWYPHDAFASPFYEITFVYQVVTVMMCCVQNISMDGMIVGFMGVICCKFKMLKIRIIEIGRSVAGSQLSESLINRVYVENKLRQKLVLCIEDHIAIFEYAKEFEDIFKYAIFLQFLENSLVICTAAFAVSQTGRLNSFSTIFGNLMYMMAIIYELFMYCYFGNEIAVQVFNIIRRQVRIGKLLEILKSDTFSRHNFRYEDLLSSFALKGILHHVAYQSFGAAAVFCWGFTPIANIIAGNNRRLPMDGWYPYNVTLTPAFEITCVHQTVAVVFACFHNVAMDTLVAGLITVACCQLEILKSNLGQIGIRKSCHDDELRNCIRHHKAIIDFTKEVEAIFNGTIILQFCVNCIIICLTAFHITKLKVFIPAEFVGMTMYMCCMIYQIFIYCWHGNEIFVQSQSVVVAAYEGNWWNYGKRFNRDLQLLMLRANRPLTLKAGNLLILSLETFVSILRLSYSLFTVLQSST
ncbi:odorant receptor Or1-like [Neodiprion lecontei]|uniref:Odorant receptor Or1-like n=1 Tax=Neodiprion lecontei TaxID=441921 RepID=A0ABM3GBJ7_NEOLC|nr:odorant receptor Or1-like [Neodiprion lecontei]